MSAAHCMQILASARADELDNRLQYADETLQEFCRPYNAEADDPTKLETPLMHFLLGLKQVSHKHVVRGSLP
jgi:hypothetical protein